MPRGRPKGTTAGSYRLPKTPEEAELKHKKFISAMIAKPDANAAARSAGLPVSSGVQLLSVPAIAEKIEEGISEAAKLAGVSRGWVIAKLKQIVERCMEAEPVLDHDGNETGEYTFNAAGATRALELIGKHLKLFGDEVTPTQQIGAAVIRLLAQEAQAARQAKAVDAQQVQPDQLRAPADPGPIPTPGDPLAPGAAFVSPGESYTHSPPPSV